MSKWGDLYSMKVARELDASSAAQSFARIENDTQDIQAKLVVVDNEISTLQSSVNTLTSKVNTLQTTVDSMRAEQTNQYNAIVARLINMDVKLNTIITNTTP